MMNLEDCFDILELQQWESDNFGFKVGKCRIGLERIPIIKDQMIREDYRLVYLISEKKLNTPLFVDERIVYRKKRLRKTNNAFSTVRSWKSQMLTNDLISLSLECGKMSRFRLDPQFPASIYRKLYVAWIKNSIDSDFASDVLVYQENHSILGMLSFKIHDAKATIGLICVDQNSRNKGIGSELMNAFEAALPDSVRVLEVVTQGINTPARAFYQNNGYEIGSVSYIYHLWNDTL